MLPRILQYLIFLSFLLSCEETDINDVPSLVNFSFIGSREENNLKLVLSSASNNAKIYYTIDNSKPDLNSDIYNDPIPFDTLCHPVKAIAAINNITGDSVSSFKYWEEWPFPPVALFSELAGVFSSDKEISMQVANVATSNLDSPGFYPAPPCVKIYYTLDGSDPTINSTQYVEPFSVEGNGTLFRIRAITAGHPFVEPSIVVENIIRIDYSSYPANYEMGLSLDDYNNAIIGKWVGNIRFLGNTQFVPYNVELNFEASGKVVGYALSQNFSYFGGFSATYYGRDGDVNNWSLNNVLSNGKAEGEFWVFNGTVGGTIKDLSFSDNKNYMEFTFWHVNKYPLRYKLIKLNE